MFVCRSQATCLLYHMFVSLSTIIFVFFKTFQIVYSEETILRDSSVRITLSNQTVNTFFQKILNNLKNSKNLLLQAASHLI